MARAKHEDGPIGPSVLRWFVRVYTRAMIKKLSAVGNSLGLVIERPILDLLKITKDTLLEVTTDGVGLVIRPVPGAQQVDPISPRSGETEPREHPLRKPAP